jgi:predicted permease
VRLARDVYRRASVLLPREFRNRFGEELEVCFAAIARDARDRRGRLAVAWVTLRSVLDLVARAPRQHLAGARAGALGSGSGSGWGAGWRDVRQAARRLRRRPSFTVASVLTLGLGIAAATSVFSLVYGVVLSPLPYPDPGRLVVVDHGGSGLGIDRGLGVTYGFYRFYREHARQAQAMALYHRTALSLSGRGGPRRVQATEATPSLEKVLRVQPELGRWFTAAEGRPGAAPAAVLSHRLWEERFGGSPDVLGRTVRLDGRPVPVVGVMPASFAFPSPETAVWLPRVVPAAGIGGWNEHAVARLRPGATAASFGRELSGLLPLLRRDNDDPARVTEYLDHAGIQPRIVSLKQSVVGDVQSTLWILLGTVGLVLLIAVANVANLFLVRAEEGVRETAVRTALGATRLRLAWGFLAETLLLTGSAGIVGVGAAAAGIRILRASAPVNVPRLGEVGMDPVVLAVALATCLAAAVLLGVIPTLRPMRDLSGTLREGGRRSTTGRTRLRGRSLLMATQVALALVLLIGAGLLFRTFRSLRAVDLGFSTRQALTFTIGLSETSYPTEADFLRFHRELVGRLAALPGVEAAGAVGNCLPLTEGMCWGETLQAEGFPRPEGEVPPVTGMRLATPGYFRTMGIPLRGRGFRSGDGASRGPVVVLSQAAARAYFPGVDAVGRRVRVSGDTAWATVVGVARDVRSKAETDEFERVLYQPIAAVARGAKARPMAYVLRTVVPPTSLIPVVRRAVADLDPSLPLAQVETLRDRIDRATAPTAFALTLIGLAAAIALLLGAVGVYAVVAYAVSQRTVEIGVRLALGARPADVLRLVMRQGGVVVGTGIAAGLVAAAALTRLMTGMLYGVHPFDPLSYVALTALMLGVAALALWFPARRAARLDPQEALRSN